DRPTKRANRTDEPGVDRDECRDTLLRVAPDRPPANPGSTGGATDGTLGHRTAAPCGPPAGDDPPAARGATPGSRAAAAAGDDHPPRHRRARPARRRRRRADRLQRRPRPAIEPAPGWGRELPGSRRRPRRRAGRLRPDAAGWGGALAGLAELRLLPRPGRQRSGGPLARARRRVGHLPAGSRARPDRNPAGARREPVLHPRQPLPRPARSGRGLGLGRAASPRVGGRSPPCSVRAGLPAGAADARAGRRLHRRHLGDAL
ncbi:MAG: hypothetical protein AVDCRST_MAG59-4257, partial [uncultured Thermomicrobiales bacterium]